MNVISRKIDEGIAIGDSVVVTPTDIDGKIVRVVVRGLRVGGELDGEKFESIHEIKKGQSIPVGPYIVVTLVQLHPNTAWFGIECPPTMRVQEAEVRDKTRKFRREAGFDD